MVELRGLTLLLHRQQQPLQAPNLSLEASACTLSSIALGHRLNDQGIGSLPCVSLATREILPWPVLANLAPLRSSVA
jgi:hypothetical protein